MSPIGAKQWLIPCLMLAGLMLASPAVKAGDQEKGEQYVRMARVAEADQDWLRSLALYNLAMKTGASLDGVGARRQYVIDKAIEANLNPTDAEKIADPTIRKESAKEMKTEDLVTEAQKAERDGNWKVAMEKYNEAASLNPLNFYLISRAQNAANKAGLKLPPMPKPSMPDEPPPPTAIPATTTTPPPTETITATTPKPADTPPPTTETKPVTPPAAVPVVAKPAEPVLTEAQLAQKMMQLLVQKRVSEAFKEDKLNNRVKVLTEINTEFTAMTDPAQRDNMLGLLKRDTFTEAVSRLSGLKRPENFNIENKIDAKNTYFYTPGGETYKLTVTLLGKPTSAFITFRVGVVPGSSPAVSIDKLDTPEGKKILENERSELEEWRKNQGLKENIMQGPGAYNGYKAQIFTLDNRALQAAVNSYVVEEGGVLMIYRTYSKRNPELDRQLKKIIGYAQTGF
ncbi:MAG TPA: hypothetical protein VL860_12835 [Planctomycetota bacterium]|jgi:hypothetical protein|nr:hypothetical protein [Planctomycetota bacterium]